ncbi:hypothetical protein FRC07_005066 [Ceratobasidium sp. 392]|nr:hypothetical protein FRC07_005066 [Ceratobasidium sp. 392]
MNAAILRIFRSYQGQTNQMPNYSIWQVLRATMAHPELFKSFDVGHSSTAAESLVGGDVACSNPTPHVLAEVSALYPQGHIASIVCIGAGHARTIQIPRSNPLHRIMPTNVLVTMKDVATDSERVAQEMATRFQDTSSVYFRFSVDQGMQDARMSHWQRRSEVVAHTVAYTQKAEVVGRMNEAVKVMVGMRKTLRAANISGKVHQPLTQQTTGVKRCPAPSPAFTGCERQVSQVTNCLLSPTSERRVCVVHGLGGSGKTQIALKAVERTLDDWTHIVYVDATTRETTISTLEGFAKSKKIGETYEDALRWLEMSSRSWLLVFDNADDPDLGVPKFIPGGSHGSVLITTRLRTLAVLGRPDGSGSECSVGGMSADEALELLLRKARMQGQELSSEETEAATKLVQIGIAKYRKQCLEQTQAALDKYSKLPGVVEEYERTVYTTWVMSYERLSPPTQQALRLMSHLHHDGITKNIFARAAENRTRAPAIPSNHEEVASRKYVLDHLDLYLDKDGRWSSNVFSAIMDELVLYSLIDYDRVNEVYMLHILVQSWARMISTAPKTVSATHTSHLLALSVDWSHDIGTHAYRRGLLLHISELLGKLGSKNVNDTFFFEKVYTEAGWWQQAEQLQLLVLDARKQALGDLHPDTLTSMKNLALTYWRRGRWDEAESLQVQVLDAKKQTLGELHSDTLISMNNLASTYSNQGRWDEAESLQAQVLGARKQTLGELHPGTLISMANLASIYLNQGRWDEAESLDMQVLDARKRQLGELHPDTLTGMTNLAETYRKQGRWSEAESLLVQVLAASKRALGELHPDTLIIKNNLASVYWSQSRWDEAESLQVQVLDARKQKLGELRPYTLTSMYNLAVTYSSMGRLDDVEALLIQIVASNKRVFGEAHHKTLTVMKSLANTYRKRRSQRHYELTALETEMEVLSAWL